MQTANEIIWKQAHSMKRMLAMYERCDQYMRWMYITLNIEITAAIAKDEIREMAARAMQDIDRSLGIPEPF